MLVLSRKVGQSVLIGDDVRVTVVEAMPGKLRLGIDAPVNVSVDRAEVRERKARDPRNRGSKT